MEPLFSEDKMICAQILFYIHFSFGVFQYWIIFLLSFFPSPFFLFQFLLLSLLFQFAKLTKCAHGLFAKLKWFISISPLVGFLRHGDCLLEKEKGFLSLTLNFFFLVPFMYQLLLWLLFSFQEKLEVSFLAFWVSV